MCLFIVKSFRTPPFQLPTVDCIKSICCCCDPSLLLFMACVCVRLEYIRFVRFLAFYNISSVLFGNCIICCRRRRRRHSCNHRPFRKYVKHEHTRHLFLWRTRFSCYVGRNFMTFRTYRRIHKYILPISQMCVFFAFSPYRLNRSLFLIQLHEQDRSK